MEKKFKSAFLKGSAAATIGTVSSLFFHFISITILTRVLNKQEFGIYALILVIVNLFNILGSLGLNITLVKFISSESKENNTASLRAIFNLRILNLILVGFIFYFFSDYILYFFDPAISKYVLLITILFFFTSIKELLFNVLQGLNKYKSYAIVQTSSAAFRVGVIVFYLFVDTISIDKLIYIELFTTFVSIFIQLLFLPLKTLLNKKPTKEIYRHIFNFSAPLYLNNIITFTYDRISIFMIGALLSPASVALYDVANKIPEALQRVFASFMIVYFPNSAKLFASGDKVNAIKLMVKALNVFSVAISLLCIISILFSREIMLIVFSYKYVEVAPAFSLLMMNFFLRIMSNIKGYSIVSAGNPSVPVKVNVISSIVNASLSLLMIPWYGFIGAVYSILIMNLLTQVSYHLYLIKLDLAPSKFIYFYSPILVIIVGGSVLLYDYSLYIKVILLVLYLILNWYFVEEFKILLTQGISALKKIKSKLKLSTIGQ